MEKYRGLILTAVSIIALFAVPYIWPIALLCLIAGIALIVIDVIKAVIEFNAKAKAKAQYDYMMLGKTMQNIDDLEDDLLKMQNHEWNND